MRNRALPVGDNANQVLIGRGSSDWALTASLHKRSFNQDTLYAIDNELDREAVHDLAEMTGNGSFRPRVVSALSRFGPGSFRSESFRPGSIRPWVVSAQFGGSFRPIFLNYQACYRRSTKYIFG